MLRLPYPAVLASRSPRRRELFGRLVESFDVEHPDVEEQFSTELSPEEIARSLAAKKARAVAARRPDALVVAGDTVVALHRDPGDYEILEKPADASEAAEMLGKLSGRTHLVVTGVCLVWPGGKDVLSVCSQVTFAELTPERIAEYVATGEPLDKAGAYGIQGHAKDFVERIEGSVTNVIGLPLEALEERLRRFERET